MLHVFTPLAITIPLRVALASGQVELIHCMQQQSFHEFAESDDNRPTCRVRTLCAARGRPVIPVSLQPQIGFADQQANLSIRPRAVPACPMISDQLTN